MTILQRCPVCESIRDMVRRSIGSASGAIYHQHQSGKVCREEPKKATAAPSARRKQP